MAPKKHSSGGKALRVIRNVYLYLVAMIGLVVFVIGTVGMVNNVLKNYVFQVNEYRSYVSPLDDGICPRFYTRPGSDEEIERTDEEIEECERAQEEQQEQYRRNEIGRELSINVAQILVGLPLWLLHWGIIQREYRRKKKKSTDQ